MTVELFNIFLKFGVAIIIPVIFILGILYNDVLDNKLNASRKARRDKKTGRDVEIIVNRARGSKQ